MSLRVSQYMAAIGVLAEHRELSLMGAKLALLNVPIGEVFVEGSIAGLVPAVPQQWISGTRVKIVFAGTGSPPSVSPLDLTENYWLIRISSTQFQLAETYAESIAGVALTTPNINPGLFKLVCSKVSEWPEAELLRWEVSHSSYSRTSIEAVPQDWASVPASNGEAKSKVYAKTIVNDTGIAFSYNTIALWTEPSLAYPQGFSFCVMPLETVVGSVVNPQTITVAAGTSRQVSYEIARQFDP